MEKPVFSPNYDFFIDKVRRNGGFEMRTFHFHKKYEIYFQADGIRRYYINDSAYLVNAGSVVLIDHDSIHKTGSVNNAPYTRFVVNFSPAFLDSVQSIVPKIDLLLCFKTGVTVIPLNPKKMRFIETVLNELWDGYQTQSEEGTALCRLQLSALLMHLANYANENLLLEEKSSKITNPTIEKIQEYISTNYKTDLSLIQISEQFYISPNYLSRLFKKTTNLTLIEYINSVRLMAAKNLLDTTQKNLEKIAAETGFSSGAHFSRVFKESTGFSPLHYRKHYKTNI